MKSDDIYNAVTDLRDDQIQAGEQKLRPARPAYFRRLGAIAAVLAVVILAGAVAGPRLVASLRGQDPAAQNAGQANTDPAGNGWPNSPVGGGSLTPYSLAQASYPKMAPYPNEMDYEKDGRFDSEAYDAARAAWTESRRALSPETDYTVGLDAYLRSVVPALMTGAGEENRAVSPLNIYMALAMLAETTAGESRQELLELLNVSDLPALRERCKALWQSNYCDDGRLTSLLAASLWLRDDMRYHRDTVATLASDYYSSVFNGKMGDAAYNEALHNWMNEQTGGLLADQIQGINLEPQTVLALVTTIYYKAAWVDEFWKTESKTFHSPAAAQTCEFMKQTDISEFYRGDGFAAAGKDLLGGGTMYFLLPDEGLTPEDLLGREEVLSFLTDEAGRESTSHQRSFVTLEVPKFDVNSQLNLRDSLNALGIEAVFNAARADFSPLTGSVDSPIVLTRALHGARLMVDEKGVTGAAYTFLAADGAAEPGELEEVELTLDRPFLFVVTNHEGLPLFLGTVRNPTT